MVETGGTSKDIAHDRDLLKQIFDPPMGEHIQKFIDMAEARLPVAERENDEKLRSELLGMIRHAESAIECFGSGQIGAGLVAYDHMHEHRANCGLNFHKKEARREMGGKGGKAGTRPRDAFWTLLEKVSEQIKNDDQVAVRKWWAQWANEDQALDSENHVALEYCTWADEEGYHFEWAGQKFTKNKRNIQKKLSEIRNP